jgi:outer membrane protein TolC
MTASFFIQTLNNVITSNSVSTYMRRLLFLILAFFPAMASAQNPMDGFIAEAIRNNLSYQQQTLTDQRADAAVSQARGLYLPSVSLDARYSEIQGGLTLPGIGSYPFAQETRMRVVQPLFQPAVISNLQIQKSLRGLEGARLRAAERGLAADVQLAYVSYARATQVVRVYENTLALASEAVRVNEKLLANGKITPATLHRAIADRSEVEQHVAQAGQQRDAAARYFNYLLGRPTATAIDSIPTSALMQSTALTADAAVSHALNAREEIEQASWGIKASEAASRLAKSSFLPGVSVAVDYGVQGNEYRFDTDHDAGSASLVLSWNVFNGGQDAARRQQAALDVERGKLGRKQAEQQVELQVRQAYDGVVVQQQAIAAAQDRVNAARRSFELMQRRYTEGVASQLEYLDARTTLTNAELNWVLTQHQYVANYIELERVAALRAISREIGR